MALEAAKPYYLVSSSDHGLIYTRAKIMLVTSPSVALASSSCLPPVFEGLDFLPRRGLHQLFACSTVAREN